MKPILDSNASKKVLIITYYWPPAGGPGVQRWLKFVKYLPDFGVQPIVYVPENPSYPIIDENLVSQVSDRAIIIKKPIFEPYGLASIFSKNKTKKISSGIIPNSKKQTFLDQLLLWIRGNIFIPDARIFWVKPSVSFLEKYISEHQIETIITSGPPHSLHLIGLELKKKCTINWLADFRDPWTTIGYHKALKLTTFSIKKHKKLEHKILNSADKIIVTSQTTKAEFQVITSKPIEVITNGYDLENSDKQKLDEKFSLAHIGSLLSERNPQILWECLSELINENTIFSSHFELKLIGAISSEVIETIQSFGLSKFINNLGYISHKEALEQQRKSQVLLLIEINSEDTKSIIPGKLFEYMVSERPILAIGPNESDFAKIIKETNTGVFVNYNEKEKLKSTIIEFYNAFLEGNLKSHAIGLQNYSRQNLTKKLVDYLP
jgi:glycosyltransferase involved in cell wall biosynthesis